MKRLLFIFTLVLILICGFTVDSSKNKWVIEVINTDETVNIAFKELKDAEVFDVQYENSDYILGHIVKGNFEKIKKNSIRRYMTNNFAEGYLVLVQNKKSQVSLKWGTRGMLYPRKVKYYIDKEGLSEAELID